MTKFFPEISIIQGTLNNSILKVLLTLKENADFAANKFVLLLQLRDFDLPLKRVLHKQFSKT